MQTVDDVGQTGHRGIERDEGNLEILKWGEQERQKGRVLSARLTHALDENLSKLVVGSGFPNVPDSKERQNAEEAVNNNQLLGQWVVIRCGEAANGAMEPSSDKFS